MDELRPVLAAVGSLFHVTPAGRAAQISERGFDPAEAPRINGGLYSIGPFAGRGFNCFVTKPRLHGVFQMFDDGLGGGLGDRVILCVPARVVAERTFDLDRTQETTGEALRGIEVPGPALCCRLLADVSYVVCFAPIPPQHVSVVGPAEEYRAEICAAADRGA
ncbi:hypothetical protein [Alienimonas californiensis]|uniref:hypothetical protein n=1 Tax=Alienimonas californiensis TaxID=2527989 RepID=UPI0011A6DE6D|nr:hypothetical protein [Alienimonas californiensis]